MKYTAHLATGGTVELELDEDFNDTLYLQDGANGGTGWLVDNVGAMVNLVHVSALVPFTPEPDVLIDGDGDAWYCVGPNRYNLSNDRENPTESREWIKEQYGLKEV